MAFQSRVKGKIKAAYVAVGNFLNLSNIVTGITAAGTTRTDATAMTGAFNSVDTNSATTKGVTLPPTSTVGVGGTVIVLNTTANAVHVYAAGSDTIDGTAGSTGVVLTNAKRCAYFVTAANTYVSWQLGVVSA